MALYIDRGLVPFFFLIIFPPSCKMYDTCCPSFFFVLTMVREEVEQKCFFLLLAASPHIMKPYLARRTTHSHTNTTKEITLRGEKCV